MDNSNRNMVLTQYTIVLITGIVLFRVFYLMWKNITSQVHKKGKYSHVKTAVVIGSGGHTAEMLRLVKSLNQKLYSPRLYILAKGDITSESKIHVAEEVPKCDANDKSSYIIERIPRSRNVGQSYFSSVFTTVYSVLYCIPVMLKQKPNLILCNGPGTCIPICLIAFAMKVFYICDVTIIFIESVCRVTSLSLSGKILLYFADEVFVQWPALQDTYKRTKYIGRLV